MDLINNEMNKLSKEKDKLRQENAELKQLVTHFSEIIEHSRNSFINLSFALEGNGDGVWDWNALTDEVIFSKRLKEILGFEEHEMFNHFSEWESRVHPDDKIIVFEQLEKLFTGEISQLKTEHRIKCKNGHYKWILGRGKIISWTEDGRPFRIVGTNSDVTFRKEIEQENQKLLTELSNALEKVKLLNGFLPICSSCKKIRDDKGYWNQIESYISNHSEAEFSHSICPECLKELYPDYIHKKTKK